MPRQTMHLEDPRPLSARLVVLRPIGECSRSGAMGFAAGEREAVPAVRGGRAEACGISRALGRDTPSQK